MNIVYSILFPLSLQYFSALNCKIICIQVFLYNNLYSTLFSYHIFHTFTCLCTYSQYHFQINFLPISFLPNQLYPKLSSSKISFIPNYLHLKSALSQITFPPTPKNTFQKNLLLRHCLLSIYTKNLPSDSFPSNSRF